MSSAFANRFIRNAKIVHRGLNYNYSKVKHINSKTNVEIICPVHGSFWQTPSNHVHGKTICPECRMLKRKWNTERFIDEAELVHGDTYDYSKTKYIDFASHVEIICPIHGSFWQTSSVHIHHRNGCKLCGCIKSSNSRRSTKEEFVIKARKVHGGLYDYTNSEYVSGHMKLKILCKLHDTEFEQTPSNHINCGHGCPKCNRPGTYTCSPSILYYLKIEKYGITAYKIGITSKSIAARFFMDIKTASITILAQRKYSTGIEAFNQEQSILKEFHESLYNGVRLLKYGGNTELFNIDIFGLDNNKRESL